MKDIILRCVRWDVGYPLSYRQVTKLMQERRVAVEHATINCWILENSPQLEAAFHHPERPVWLSWRLDETYLIVRGPWSYLYRAVYKTSQTVDFLLTEQRNERAAMRCPIKAIRCHGVPTKVTRGGREANGAALGGYNESHGTAIIIHQVKYLNNGVKQDHRAIKRVMRSILEFKGFEVSQGGRSVAPQGGHAPFCLMTPFAGNKLTRLPQICRHEKIMSPNRPHVRRRPAIKVAEFFTTTRLGKKPKVAVVQAKP